MKVTSSLPNLYDTFPALLEVFTWVSAYLPIVMVHKQVPGVVLLDVDDLEPMHVTNLLWLEDGIEIFYSNNCFGHLGLLRVKYVSLQNIARCLSVMTMNGHTHIFFSEVLQGEVLLREEEPPFQELFVVLALLP